MLRPFVGLVLGMCLLLFASPLIAADTPKALAGMEMSTLQALDDTQLGQIYGTGPFNNAWKSYVTARLASSLTQLIPRWLEGVGPFSPPPDVLRDGSDGWRMGLGSGSRRQVGHVIGA